MQERGLSLVTICDGLERQHKPRREHILRSVETYEGKALGGLYPSAYLQATELVSDSYDQVRANEARACVNTALAKIAGKQRPKAQFCCSDADWSTKRKAKKLEKFVEAVMLQRQNGLTDGFAVGLLAFRDSCVADIGVIKFWADHVNRRVQMARVLPWEILVDPNEARNGEPQNWFHVYAADRFLLAEQFPEHRDAIMEAEGLEADREGVMFYGYGADVHRAIKVREGWRLPLGPDTPGRHSVIIAGSRGYADLTVSKKKPDGDQWTRAFPPFETIVWEPWMMGIFGQSLVDNISGMCEELNASMQRWAEAEQLASNLVIFATRGTVNKEDLEDNRAAIVIEVEPGGSDPRFHVPDVVSATSITWQKYLIERIHDVSGLSEQATTGTTQLGANASGEAIREENKLGSDRFSIQWQGYERFLAIGASRQIVSCMRELCVDEGEDIIVKWPGASFLEEIKWSKVNLDEDQYHVRVYAVSGLVNTPQDRLALATELVDRGFLSKEAYLRVIQAGDLDSELENNTTIQTWVDRRIEAWLDAEPGDDMSRYGVTPPRWLGSQVLTDMLLRAGIAYLHADLAGAPQFNLTFLERFLMAADAVIQELADREAERSAAARGNTLGVEQVAAAGQPAQPQQAPAPAAPPAQPQAPPAA